MFLNFPTIKLVSPIQLVRPNKPAQWTKSSGLNEPGRPISGPAYLGRPEIARLARFISTKIGEPIFNRSVSYCDKKVFFEAVIKWKRETENDMKDILNQIKTLKDRNLGQYPQSIENKAHQDILKGRTSIMVCFH